MATEENLMILKMLQDGTLSPEQAAELIKAVDAPAAPTPPALPTPPAPPVPPTPPMGRAIDLDDEDGETLSRARAKLAAAREKVAGVQEKLAAAEEKLVEAEKEPGALEKLEEILRDIPGRRSLSEALRGIDPARLASSARRQARRLGKQVKHSIEGINFEGLSETMQGDPTLIEPREAACALPPGMLLRVKNPLGDIEAIGADVSEVKAAGTLKIWAADRAAAEALARQIELVIEDGGEGGPSLTVIAPPRLRRVALDLKVFVPQAGGKVSLLSPSGDVSARNLKGGAVVLATQSGDARASEIVGDVVVETASGEIALEGIMGSVSARSLSGDVHAIRVSGQAFKAETQSGDATLREATVPTVQIKTVSGDATVENVSGRTLVLGTVSGDGTASGGSFDDATTIESTSGSLTCSPKGPLALGTLSLSSLSGDVELTLPARTHASLELKTQSGEISGRVKTEGGEQTLGGSTHVHATLGSGPGAAISVHSVSGDLMISQE